MLFHGGFLSIVHVQLNPQCPALHRKGEIRLLAVGQRLSGEDSGKGYPQRAAGRYLQTFGARSEHKAKGLGLGFVNWSNGICAHQGLGSGG